MWWLRFSPLLACAALFAQAPSDLFEKAPPQVDEALRARVSKFFQAHVDGKFRLADQVVAEDSKDAFFAADKSRFRAFEIVKINYKDNFAKASVVTSCDSEMVTPFGRFPVKVPVTTLWKVENGEWFWYKEPVGETVDTPFGKMYAGGGKEATPPPSGPRAMPDMATILNQVKVDRTAVELSSYEPASAEVTLSNAMPGNLKLSVSYVGFPGFQAVLDRTEVGPKESAKLRLSCKPADKAPKPTLNVRLRVETTGQEFPIKVTFRVPPEIQKILPK